MQADDFNNFYGDLDEETTLRKKAEEDRVARMEREIAKIEKVLSTETKRRIEASKALQNMFEVKITAIQEEFKEELRTVFEPLQAQIDALVSRVETIEKTMQARRRRGWVSGCRGGGQEKSRRGAARRWLACGSHSPPLSHRDPMVLIYPTGFR
jgi:hypothetical protein